MKKRIASLFLALVMLLGLLPTATLAAPMSDERPETPMGDDFAGSPEAWGAQPDSSASLDADAEGQPLSTETELPEAPEDETPASLFATTTGQISSVGNLTISLDTGSAHAHHGDNWNDGFRPKEGEQRLASYDGGTVEVRNGNQIFTKERDRFKNADYLYVPFTLSANVPAHCAITYTFSVNLWHRRNSKGGVHYWVEVLDGQPLNSYLKTQDSSTRSANSLERLCHSNKDGGSTSLTWTVTFDNYIGGTARTIQRPMAYYVGASKSTSALNSYHHQVESAVTFNLQSSSTRKRMEYDPNDGSGYTFLYYFNDSTTIKSGPTKTGYTFTGWQDTDNTGKVYQAGQSTSSGLDLKAQWENAQYTVYLNAQGGSVNPATTTATYGKFYSLPTPTRTGYTFQGWFTKSSGGSSIGRDTLVSATSNHTLYARWTAMTPTVTLNANSGSVSTSSKKVTYGAAYGSLPAPTRTGYTFQGWYTAQTGGAKVESATTVANGENHTLYAHWTAKTATVTFNASGGTLEGTASKSVTYDATYGDLPTPTKANYTFTGWYTAASGGSQVTSATKVTNANAHTLYARWSRNTYTVTFNTNGGSDVESRKVNAGDKLGALPTTTRTGYTFGGWFSGDAQITKDTVPAGNVTYTARWSVNTYTVSYNANGGAFSGDAGKSVTYGQPYGDLPNPTRVGYTFAGWYTAASGGTQVSSNTTLTTASNHTLYAHWTAISYPITVNGVSTSATADQTYADILPADPAKTGYTFQYWEDEKGNRIVPAASIDPERLPTAISPVWTANTYTVTFDVNGGNALSDSDKTKTVTFGQPYGVLPVPTHPEGMVFRAWYDASSGGNLRDASSLVKKAGDHTLYARWESNHVHALGSAQWGDKTFSALGQTADASNSVTAATDVLGKIFDSEKPSWFLAGDVTIGTATVIPSGKTLNLCLNGYKLEYNGAGSSAFVVEDGGTLNICDCNGSHGSHTVTSAITGTDATIQGGLITRSQKVTSVGTGVYVEANGTFNLYGGAIAGIFTAADNGSHGAVRVEGTFHMYGGELCHNKIGCGGAVNICDDRETTYKSHFYLHGGSIHHNYASLDDGGGVCVNESAACTISGGSIVDNVAKEGGGGIHSYGGSITLSGSPVIQNNTTKTVGVNYNLRLDGGAKLAVSEGFSSAAPIGVSSTTAPTADAPVAVGTDGSGAYARYFVADAAGQEVVDNGGVLALKLHSHPLCGETCGHTSTHDAAEYTALTQAMVDSTRGTNFYLESGNYYLAGDITTEKILKVDENAAVNLCFNGHTINGTKSTFGNTSYLYVDKNGTLNCSDCQGGGGFTATGYGMTIIAGYTNSAVNLYGGTFSNQAGSTCLGGYDNTAYMVDGADLEARGSAASLTKGSLTVKSGTLTSSSNPAIQAGAQTTVRIEGGVITSAYNWTIANSSTAFTITGGTITNSSSDGFGVRCGENSMVILSGSPTIQGAKSDICIYRDKNVHLTIEGEVTGSWSVYPNSDNPKYITETAPMVISTPADVDASAHFTVASAVQGGIGIRDAVDGEGKHTLQLYKQHLHDGVEYENYTVLTADMTLVDGGHYLLAANLDRDGYGALTVPEGATVDLCLNGYELSGGSIKVDGTLNLYDCKGTGKVKNGGAVIQGAGTVNYYGGTLEGGTSTLVPLYASGVVNLYATPTIITGCAYEIRGNTPGFLHIAAPLTKPETPLRVNFGEADAVNITNHKQVAVTSGWAAYMNDAEASDHFVPGEGRRAKVEQAGDELILRLLRVDMDGVTHYPSYTTGKLTAADLAAPESRTGYIWDGWYNPTGNTKITANYLFSSDTTLEGRWIQCDHSANITEPTVVPATCNTAGSSTFTCSVCGLEVVEAIKATGHDFDADKSWHVDEENGVHYQKCLHCDQRRGEAEHIWDEGAVTTEPTAGADGVMTFTCTVCSATTTEAIPALVAHTVTYTVDDYTNEAAPTQESVVKGTVLTLPDGLTRTGYTLSGWALLDEEGVPGQDVLTGTFAMPDRDVEFQIRWERIPNYALQPGETIVLPDGTVIKNETDNTVTIDQNGDGEAETTITLPGGGSVTIQEGTDGGKDKVVVPPGAEVTTTPGDGGQGPVITIGDGDGKVDPSGKVDAPVGTTITDKGGNKITITEGEGGTVDPEGVVTFPEGEGGKVTVTDKDGKTTEVDVPGGGDGLDVTPGGKPIVNNPDGSLTIPDGQGGSTTVTVPEDGEEGAELDDAGNLTLPGGSTVTKTDGEGNQTEVTVPDGGGTVTPGGKLDQEKPVGIFIPTDIDDDHVKGAITVTADADKLEWRPVTDPESPWADVGESATVTLNELEVGDYEFRYKETDTHAAGDTTLVQVRPKSENAKRLDLAGDIAHGTVTKRRDWVNPGDTVNLTAKPDQYYELAALTASYEGGEDITPTVDPANSAHYTFTMPEADVTVTATFRLIVYTIDYQYADVADGSFTAQSPSVTLAVPTREGYTFDGWSFTPGGEIIRTVTVAGLLERARNNTVLLYPRWTLATPAHTHVWAEAWETSETHHWHVCTADGCDITDYAACGETGAAYGAHVYDGDQDAICNTCGYTRTIVEPDPDTFTVTFDAQGGSAVSSQRVTRGKLVAKPASPVKEGFTFGGWVTEENGSALWKFHTGTVDRDMTLYATWTAQSAGSVVTPDAPVDIPGGGTVAKDPDTGDVTITPPEGDSGATTTITPPESGGDVTVDPDSGELTVPPGSTVDPGNGGKIELPDGGKVDGQGNITLPDGGDAVTVPDGEGGSTTITAPDGGGTVKPTEDGGLEIPGGSTVTIPDGQGGETEITVPDEGGKVSGGGTVTVPGGSTVTIPDGEGGKTEITVPEGGEATITTTDDGKVEIPGGSTVKKPDGSTVTVPSGGGIIDPATGDVTPVKPTTPSRPGGSASNKPSVSTGGQGGKVEADRNGNVTITPDKGYEIDKVTVNGKEVTVPADGKLTGLKRTDKVVVTFKEVSAVTVEQFSDVKPTDWFYDSVKDIVEQGLMNGTGETTFAPSLTTSRAMIATILWRLAGSPEPGTEPTYPDCVKDSWYAKAVAWASGQGVVKGYGNGGFGPDDPITREQLAVMLYRYAGSPATSGALDSFVDSGKAGSWAIDALRWAVEQGIITGKGGGVLDPTGRATRAEAAAMLQRFRQSEK